MSFTWLVPRWWGSRTSRLIYYVSHHLEFPHAISDPINLTFWSPYGSFAWHIHVHDCLWVIFILHSHDIAIPAQSDLSGIFFDVINYSQFFSGVNISYLISSRNTFYLLSIRISFVSRIGSSFFVTVRPVFMGRLFRSKIFYYQVTLLSLHKMGLCV